MIPKKTAFFLILCMVAVSSKFSSKTVQQKIEDILLFDSKSLVNSSFLYGLCHDTNEKNRTCNIVLQYIYLDINKPNKELSCPVDITTDLSLNSNTRITLYKIVRIGEDKAVLLLTDEDIILIEEEMHDNEIDPDYDYTPIFYDTVVQDFGPESNREQQENILMQNITELRAINIDLSNCRTNTNKISLPVSLTKNTTISVLPFKDTYDIVITEKLLHTTNVYKGTYSLQGTTIMNSRAWGLRYPDNRIIAFGNVKLHSSDGGYLTINSIRDSDQQSFIRISATLINQRVKSLKLDYHINVNKTYDVIYSTSYDMIGICLVFGKNAANCSFFNMEGVKFLETTVKIDGAYIISMYNLPNGFLLFTEECFDCDKFPLPTFHPGNFQYAVTRFDFTSETIIKTSLPESSWLKSLHSWIYFFENEAEEICVTFLSLKNIPPFVPYFNQNDTLEVIIKCFLDL